MSRRPDWEDRLVGFLAKALVRPYKPGDFDCLLFPAGSVKAVTGHDHGRGHRGKYSTPEGAARYLRKLGAATPEEYLDTLFPERPIGFTMRGDLVLVDIEGQRYPGVCIGSDALVIAATEGGGADHLHRIPRELWIRAWAIE
jgi:hypothetical protein